MTPASAPGPLQHQARAGGPAPGGPSQGADSPLHHASTDQERAGRALALALSPLLRGPSRGSQYPHSSYLEEGQGGNGEQNSDNQQSSQSGAGGPAPADIFLSLPRSPEPFNAVVGQAEMRFGMKAVAASQEKTHQSVHGWVQRLRCGGSGGGGDTNCSSGLREQRAKAVGQGRTD